MSRSSSSVVLAATLLVSLAACDDSATSPIRPATATPPSAAHELIPGTSANIVESWSVSGDLVAGGIANLNFTLTNTGSGDYTPTAKYFGETRPRIAFAEVVIPVGMKRQVPTGVNGVSNPYILCEAYRGTHGGLTQAFYSDVCRIWYYGALPAGASITATLPVKLQGQGDFTPWGGAEVYPADPWGSGAMTYLNGNLWLKTDVHVNPAPPKTTATGPATAELAAGGKASTGSPAAGSSFYMLLTARNTGKIDADNPSITATVPAGVTITSAAFDYGSCTVTGQLVACSSTHPVFPGMTYNLAIYADAPTGAPGTYITTGTWATTSPEASLTNNTSTVSVLVK
jgi:hypothetical protein